MKVNTQSSNHLVISLDNASKKNNEQEKIIDKKIKKIEQLKGQIKKINYHINVAKKLYEEHCKDEKVKLSKLREHLITKLYERFKQKSFLAWQKEMLEAKIMNEANELVSAGYQSEIALNIQEEISNFKMDNMGDDEKDMMNEIAKEFFKNMGINMDEHDFDFDDLKNPEFREQFDKEYAEKNEKEYHEYHRKNNEQLQKKQKGKVKATDKDFRKLYKNLVKKAHPDLVTNALEKEIREEWMKKLSFAWKERSYYKLLLLDKQINKDSSMNITINESQTKPLINELNEMIRELEVDKYKLKHNNPDTSFYYENFNARSEKGVLKKVLDYKDLIEYQIEEIEDETIGLKTQKSTKELLTEIRDNHIGYYDFSDDFF